MFDEWTLANRVLHTSHELSTTKLDIFGRGSLGLSASFSFAFLNVCITSPYIPTLLTMQIYRESEPTALKRSTCHCLKDTQRDGGFEATTVCFFLPVAFFFGRTTFIGSGAADELDEG